MKKTNIKRFFVLFCVLACVFSMTACTNTISSDSAKTSLKDMKVNQYASDMVQWAEDMLVYLDQTSDAQIKADGEAAKTLSYVNGKVNGISQNKIPSSPTSGFWRPSMRSAPGSLFLSDNTVW